MCGRPLEGTIGRLETQAIPVDHGLSLLALMARNVLIRKHFSCSGGIRPHYLVDLPNLCLATLVTILNACDQVLFFYR